MSDVERDLSEIMSQCASAESVAAFNRVYGHVHRLRVALVDAVHRLHSTPQYQLVDGIGMSEGGLGHGVHFRAADGERYDVYASPAEMAAIDKANAAEKERTRKVLAMIDAGRNNDTDKGDGAKE